MRSKNRVKVCYASGCSVEFETPKPARMYCNSDACNAARAEAKKLEKKLRRKDPEGKFVSNAVVRNGVAG